MRHAPRTFVATAVLALMVSACASNPSASTSATESASESSVTSGAQSETSTDPASKFDLTVAVADQAPHTTETAIMSAAMELGYFDDAGLSVKPVFTDGSTAAVQAVASGSAQVTAAGVASALASVEKGVPVKVVGGLVVNWPWRIAVLDDSKLTKPADLAGKKIGVIALSSGSYPYAKGFVDDSGMDMSSVDYIAVGVGSQALGALQTGKVDALALYTQAYANIESQGAKLRYFDNPKAFDGVQSLAFTASSSLISEHKEVLTKYLQAEYKALLFCITNSKACVEMTYKRFPEVKDASSGLDDDLTAFTTWLATATPQTIKDGDTAAGSYSKWGSISNAAWDATQNYTVFAGQISKKLSLDKFWDPSLLTAADKFDAASVVDAAKNYKG